jgi:uncharacterized protein
VDLTSRLRAIVRPPSAGSGPPRRELTYEPDDGYRADAVQDLEAVADALGGRVVPTPSGPCLTIDRRYEADRWHGDRRVGDCEPGDLEPLQVLDPGLRTRSGLEPSRIVFVDIETTGLSGGAGTLAFLVGCGYFDLGAFHVRQFLLLRHNAERALLAAAGELLGEASLLVTYNGKSFDVPVLETRWAFHRLPVPFEELPHLDMVHVARRFWKGRDASGDDRGCRLTTLERALLNLRRNGDVPGIEIPARFFHFLRTADAAPLEPVLEHNRLDLISLAAILSRAAGLAAGRDACRDAHEALAVGRVLERAGLFDRAEACYRLALRASAAATRAEALYRLGLRCRRDRRFDEAARCWQELIALTETRPRRAGDVPAGLRRFAMEALAIHHEHRNRNLTAARTMAMCALEDEEAAARAEGMRHRIARLDRKLANQKRSLFPHPHDHRAEL